MGFGFPDGFIQFRYNGIQDLMLAISVLTYLLYFFPSISRENFYFPRPYSGFRDLIFLLFYTQNLARFLGAGNITAYLTGHVS